MFVFFIQEILNKKNLSLEELSKKTKIDIEQLSNIINNKIEKPTLEDIYKIAKALNLKMENLFYTIDNIEELKERLNKYIDLYGLNSIKTKELSYLLDKLIYIKAKEDIM